MSESHFVRVIAIVLVCFVCVGVGYNSFTFSSAYDSLVPMISFVGSAIDSVKGIIGLDVFNGGTDIQNDIGREYIELPSGESVTIRDYIQARILSDNKIVDWNVFPWDYDVKVLYVSNIIYSVTIKNNGAGLFESKQTWACLRFKLQVESKVIDCLWIDFDDGLLSVNEDNNSFIPFSGNVYEVLDINDDNSFSTNIYQFKNDTTLTPLFNLTHCLTQGFNYNGQIIRDPFQPTASALAFKLNSQSFSDKKPKNGVLALDVRLLDILDDWIGG